MNIFFLDWDLVLCSQYHVDKHTIKMTLEYAQILCTVYHLQGLGHLSPYKATHTKHPSVLWCNESRANWLWLQKLCMYLNEEYKFRYPKSQKDHLAYTKIKDLPVPESLPDIGFTSPRLAMPEQCKKACPIESYRGYYNSHKQHLFSWKSRNTPYFIVTV